MQRRAARSAAATAAQPCHAFVQTPRTCSSSLPILGALVDGHPLAAVATFSTYPAVRDRVVFVKCDQGRAGMFAQSLEFAARRCLQERKDRSGAGEVT